MTYTAHSNSPLGGITLASDGHALTGLWFDGQKHFPATYRDRTSEDSDLPVFKQTQKWLDIYFAGECPDFIPPLAPQGTLFQQKIWELLLAIPYGKTMTYGEIARQYAGMCHDASLQGTALHGATIQRASTHGASLHSTTSPDSLLHDTSPQDATLKNMSQPTKSMSAQAVGGAVGHNPVSLIIPCHRVIGANGSLTGYAGGLERKKYLLELEQGL